MVRENVDKEKAADVLAAKQQMEALLAQINDKYLEDIREAGILLAVLSELFSYEMRWFHSVQICRNHVEFELDEYTFKLVFHEGKMIPQLFINDDPDLNFAFFIGVAAGSKEICYQYVIETEEGDKKGSIMAYSQPDACMRIQKIWRGKHRVYTELLDKRRIKIVNEM